MTVITDMDRATALILRSALRLLKVGIIPTRGFTRRKALDKATEITGLTYKNSLAELERARNDLGNWLNA